MRRRLTNWEAKDTERSRQRAMELCENARGQLVLHYPFVGHLGLQIEFVPVVDSRIRTIATNGKVIYIRPEWICQLPLVTRAAVVAHTIWTAALCHSFRRGGLDARRFDAASDLEVYSLLLAERVSMAVKPDYADRFPKHQAVEEIYKALPENPMARGGDADVHLYLAGQVKLPDLPEEAATEKQKDTGEKDNGESDAQESGGEENGASGDSKAAESGSGHCKPVPGAPGRAEKGNDSDDGQSGAVNPQDGRAEERDAAVDTSCDPMMREVWRQRILETAQAYEMMYGTLPGDIAEVVRQFRESKIDYMQKLRRHLTLHSGGEAQWLPPAKRFVWQKMYLPSRRNGALEAVLAIDTSGSTQGYLEKFFGDTLKIMRQFGKFRLTVIQCDAQVTDVQAYTEDSRAPRGIHAKGGGGTSFVPVFDYIREKRLCPRVMLYFTDGFGDAPEKAPDFPVIWVLTPAGQKPCGWGEVIQLDGNEDDA